MLLALVGTIAAIAGPSLTSDAAFDETTLPDGRVVRAETKPGPSGEAVRHGEYVVTASDGTKLVTGEFADGARTGRWTFRHANGEVSAAGKYKNGERISSWRSSWPSGEKRASGKFRAGVPTGDWTFFDRSGDRDPRMCGELQRVDGVVPGSELSVSGWLLDGEPHGPWIIRWPDGTSMYDGAFVRGRAVGDHRYCHLGGVEDAKLIGPEAEGEWAPCPILTEPDELGDVPAVRSKLVRTGPDAGAESIAAIAAALSEGTWAELSASADEYMDPGRSPDAETARAAARWALLRLAELKGGASSERGDMIDVLRAVFGGVDLGWADPDTKEAAERNRLALLRAHGLFSLYETSDAFWMIDAMASRPKVGQSRPEKALELRSTTLRVPLRSWVRAIAEAEKGSKKKRTTKKRRRPTPSVAAHDRAVEWLVGAQEDEGHWSATYDELRSGRTPSKEAQGHDAGVTGLALVVLMRDGNSITEGPHAGTVAAGVRRLIEMQAEHDGAIRSSYMGEFEGRPVRYYSPLWIYDHAICTWALCEALSRGSTPALDRAARRAVEVLMKGKNAYGVWRYAWPADGSNDTSVTAWAARALRAADRAGLSIDRSYGERCIQWVDEMTDPGTGRVGYLSTGSKSARVSGINDHYPTNFGEPMTGCGMLMRLWHGQTPDQDLVLKDHAELLLRSLPRWDADSYTVDFYYWLVGSEAMHWMGGKYLEAWTEALEPALVDSQQEGGTLAGSWDPVGAWGFAGGRVYSTAAAALSLTADRGLPVER